MMRPASPVLQLRNSMIGNEIQSEFCEALKDLVRLNNIIKFIMNKIGPLNLFDSIYITPDGQKTLNLCLINSVQREEYKESTN